MEKMYINNELATDHGIRMGENFVSELTKPSGLKEYITNETRLGDGKVVVVHNIKKSPRSLILPFNIHSTKSQTYEENKAWLENELYKGAVDIKVDDLGTDVTYHLIYTGKSISYAVDLMRENGKLSVGFEEPNPADRGTESNSIINAT